jgi:U3 small nucleolar RNA-associated protein 10
VRLDSRFKPFAQSLFSRSSLTVTRDQLTKEENEQLDRSLRAFLQLLSNHFLTPAAFQVLEYCIRRYK